MKKKNINFTFVSRDIALSDILFYLIARTIRYGVYTDTDKGREFFLSMEKLLKYQKYLCRMINDLSTMK